ncbi:hypothetical protein Pmani_039328, partial [Petrolisthes manimaculis]
MEPLCCHIKEALTMEQRNGTNPTTTRTRGDNEGGGYREKWLQPCYDHSSPVGIPVQGSHQARGHTRSGVTPGQGSQESKGHNRSWVTGVQGSYQARGHTKPGTIQ